MEGKVHAARLLAGRANRRRVLAGLAAAILVPAARAEAGRTTTPMDRGGMIVARIADETVKTDYLSVPGARLYYEVAGAGPVLLIIPGGPADAEGFVPIARLLEDRYTVVRYDPRGISRSSFAGPAEDVAVETHAGDARLLLQAVGSEPAYVLGHSGGAVIGLALAEHHPEVVKTLVAHEPPLVQLLPDGDERREAGQEIYDTYLQEGPEAAMAKFMAAAGMGESAPPVEMSPEAMDELNRQFARMEQNLDFFFGHYLMPISTYTPDIATLQDGTPQVFVGVGEASAGQEAADTALALAELLGTAPIVFPGDHAGPSTHPDEFAETLHETLQAE